MNAILRRSLFAGGLAALVAKIRPAKAMEPEPIDAEAEPQPRIIDVPFGGPWRVHPDRIELVHRWEIPEILAGPQPVPLSVSLRPSALAGGTQLLARTWAPESVRHCRLCSVCNACVHKGVGPEMICHVIAPAELTEETAALFQTGFPWGE